MISKKSIENHHILCLFWLSALLKGTLETREPIFKRNFIKTIRFHFTDLCTCSHMRLAVTWIYDNVVVHGACVPAFIFSSTPLFLTLCGCNNACSH